MCNSKKNWDLFFCVCGSKSETDILLVPITVDGRMIIVGSNHQNIFIFYYSLSYCYYSYIISIKLKQSAFQMSCKEAEQLVKFPLFFWIFMAVRKPDQGANSIAAMRSRKELSRALYSIHCSFWWVLVYFGQKDFPSDQNHR